MPRDRHSSQSAFDTEVLSPQALDRPGGVESALQAIESICHRGGPEVARMVIALNASRSYLLEHLVSMMEAGAYGKLLEWIREGFPTPTTPNIMDATSMHFLQRLSSSLRSVNYPSTADVLPTLRASRRKVELAFGVIKALEDNTDIDPLPFDSMGIAVPTTAVEVRGVYVQVLSRLRSVLEEHLYILRNPAYSDAFRSSYTRAAPSSESDRFQNPSIPLVQSMNSSLYFENVEGFGEWPILLSAGAQKDLRGIGQDKIMFQAAMKRIEQLSQGLFSRGNQRPLTAPGMKVPIYTAWVVGDKRIVYQIDCVPDHRNSYEDGSQYECQAIRIFGIFALARLHRKKFWDTLSRQLERRGPDYIERCAFRNKPLSTDDEGILPGIFPPLLEQTQETQETLEPVKASEEDVKEIHSMLVLDKFVTLSQTLLDSILTDKEVVHVFSVSTQEREIIEHKSSCYVIGRSGTGKTTTMLFKMLAIQLNWQRFPEMGPKPRQLFVTQSQDLAKKVGEYFAKLKAPFEVAAQKETGQSAEPSEQENELIGQEYNKRWSSDVPEKFSELLDEHFPLFITYDKLCSMLESDIGLGSCNKGSVPSRRHTVSGAMPSMGSTSSSGSGQFTASKIASSSDYMQQSRKNFVSYGVFLSSYWDHLPQTSTRKLDPALVFGEFMGVIKGSEDTVGTKNGCLDREAYNSLSFRTQATFSHKRDDIYDLFMAYEKRKELLDYDAADRTHRILEVLRRGGLADQKVDYLYVDEVQDNLLIDTLLLRMICINQNGLFWAGDTAQTISIGSSFRFADLKAYQYRVEKRLSHEQGLTPIEPKTFELVTNHRSHSGIVNCARSVIELIIRFWPNSIDALKPERATTQGFRPIFFTGQEDTDLVRSFFMNNQGEAIDFGAEQCILVRNDVTKAKLEERLPQLGRNMFMTLYESKGLEFNDVILYNFFEDSTATPNQWRLVLQDATAFDETRHASICVELKFLYVAITRARKNLWIVDSSASAEPMKVFWSDRGQIEIWSSAAEIPNLAVKSTAEEWLTTGVAMFRNGRYALASAAFLRAGRERQAKICDAYLLQEKAGLVSITAGTARTQAFLAAANAFSACARDCSSKQEKERLTCYEAAGDCYSEARDHKRAGDNYRSTELYDKSARAYGEGGRIDEMVEVFTRYKINSVLHVQLVEAARIHYFKHLNTKAAIKLFDSNEDALKFLENKGLEEAHIQLLAELGKVLELSAIHAKNGHMLKAAEVLNASTARGAEHVRQMTKYLLVGLRQGFTIGIGPSELDASPTLSRLLELTDPLDKSAMAEKVSNEFSMFQAIRHGDHATLRTLAKTFSESNNDVAALLCLDRAFSSPLKLQGLSSSEVQASLSLYFDYVCLLKKVQRDGSLAKGSNNQKLFGFQVQGENRLLVPENTLLHGKIIRKSTSSKKGVSGHKCSSDEVRQGITDIITSRIRDRTNMQKRAYHNVHGFALCTQLLLRGNCSPPGGDGSCTFQHLRAEDLTVDWYQSRLHVILLQFQILELAQMYDLRVARYWLGILYSTLHPPFQRLGSLAKLAVASIPESWTSGLTVVRDWTQRVCCGLSGNSPEQVDGARRFFVVACTLAFDFDNKSARRFVSLTPMFNSKLWPQSSSRGAGNLIIQDFAEFLSSQDRDSLTLGASYLHGLFWSELLVDLNTLCDVIERITGLFIMAQKIDPQDHVLHEAALPRSWFIKLIPDTALRKDTSSFFKFVSVAMDFMRQIDAQVHRYPMATTTTKERFVVDGGRVTGLMGPFYITRICLCLFLMGYNTPNPTLKERVLASIQSLHKGNGQITPRVYQRYAEAKGWDGLVDEFAESLKHDQMILLLHHFAPGHRGRWSWHVRPVTHNKLDRVPKVLLSITPDTGRNAVTRPPQEQPRVEAAAGAEPNVDHSRSPTIGAPQNIPDGQEAEVDTSDGHHGQEPEEIRINAAIVIQEAYRAHRGRLNRQVEQKQAVAARKIQAAYRRHLKRKRVPRKGIEGAQARFWNELREKSTEMDWPKDSQYYLLFRIPLGYILACLDTIGAFFQSEKKEVNKQIEGKSNKAYGELMDALDKYSKLFKQTVALQKKLSPFSVFHKKGSVSDLQQAVLEVKAIVDSLDDIPESRETRKRIKERWNRGVRWIFEKQGSKAKGKEEE